MSGEYELVPVSPLEKLRKEVEELKKAKEGLPTNELVNSLRDLSDYVDKLIVVDTELHSRITDLMIKITDLTKESKLVFDLLSKAIESNEKPKVEKPQIKKPISQKQVSQDLTPKKPISPIDEIEMLRKENEKLTQQLSEIEKIYRDREIKNKLKNALQKYKEVNI